MNLQVRTRARNLQVRATCSNRGFVKISFYFCVVVEAILMLHRYMLDSFCEEQFYVIPKAE